MEYLLSALIWVNVISSPVAVGFIVGEKLTLDKAITTIGCAAIVYGWLAIVLQELLQQRSK